VPNWGRIAETARLEEEVLEEEEGVLVEEALCAPLPPALSVQLATTHGTMTLTLVLAPVLIAPENTIVLENVLLNTP